MRSSPRAIAPCMALLFCSSCLSLRAGVGPSVDTLGNVGVDIKLGVGLDLPIPGADKHGMTIGPAMQVGGGTSNRQGSDPSDERHGHYMGYAGLSLNTWFNSKEHAPSVVLRTALLGGKRVFPGLNEIDSVGSLALLVSPMFMVKTGDKFGVLVGPELQADVLFEKNSGARQQLAVFSLPLTVEFLVLLFDMGR